MLLLVLTFTENLITPHNQDCEFTFIKIIAQFHSLQNNPVIAIFIVNMQKIISLYFRKNFETGLIINNSCCTEYGTKISYAYQVT